MDGVANFKADLPWTISLVGVDGTIGLCLKLGGDKVLDGIDGGRWCAGLACRVVTNTTVI